MDYTTPPHSRVPTDAADGGPPHHITPIQTGSSSNYEVTSGAGAPRARTAYTAATPVTMRGEYGEAAHMLGMTGAGGDVGLPHAAVASPIIGGPGPAESGAVSEKTAEAAARAHGGPTPNFDFGGAIGSLSGGDERKKMLSQPPAVNASQVGRSLVWKVGKGVKRGDLPFMLVFIACLVIFLSALSGIGYVDPDSIELAAPGSDAPIFQPGKPVAPILIAGSEDDVVEKRKAWEQEVGRKARPKDGAWMQTHRDDRAVRRKPAAAFIPPPAEGVA